MKLSEWAEQECRIACKKENPNFNFDGDEFDYGCSCYKSALKAYKCLLEDGRSGMSWGFTTNILERLMHGKPLTPITDEDFFKGSEVVNESDEYLKERGLKSSIQCPRMSSLFREETLDGTVTYHDVDRAYFINVEDPRDTYGSSTGFLDKMFPINMPYYPPTKAFKIYAQTFLTDAKNGDFDTKGILYVITPQGERVDVNLFYAEKDGKMAPISKEEYDDRLSRRIDQKPSSSSVTRTFAKEAIEGVASLNNAINEQPVMIQWTGRNLKEVIDFTGKSPKFDEWFKSWEDFENYVHSHDDILKLFCEDGSHYEVPVGAWIVKTPDGYNIPSRFRFIQKPAEWSERDEKMLVAISKALGCDTAEKILVNEGVTLIMAAGFLESLRPSLQPKQKQPKVDLEKVVMIDNVIMNLAAEGYNDGYKTRPFYEEVLRRLNARKRRF